MKLVVTALAVALLAAVGASSASGAGSAGIDLAAMALPATAAQAIAPAPEDPQKDIAENAKAGKSLAELAVAKSKTRDGLVAAIIATLDKPTALTQAAVAKLVDGKGRPNAGKDGKNEKGQDHKGQTNGRPIA